MKQPSAKIAVNTTEEDGSPPKTVTNDSPVGRPASAKERLKPSSSSSKKAKRDSAPSVASPKDNNAPVRRRRSLMKPNLTRNDAGEGSGNTKKKGK